MKNKKEIISYLFFGVLTTVVNLVFYQLFSFIFGEAQYLTNNILSWIITVAFAFITNKIWVFHSSNMSLATVGKELFGFVGARLLSLLIEEAGLFLLIDILLFKSFYFTVIGFLITGTLIAKLIMQIIVIVTNYFFSKFVVFKK